MIDEQQVAASLLERLVSAARAVANATTVPSVLETALDLALLHLPGDQASITLAAEGLPRTTAATHEAAAEADRLQLAHDAGPCVEAMRTGARVVWDGGDSVPPVVAERLRELGIASACALPMAPDWGATSSTGTLCLYSREAGTFDDGDLGLAEAFALLLVLAIRSVVTELGSAVREEQLREAIKSRDLIGQAKGVLMAREGCTADQAFDMLRRASQRQNEKLRDLAARIVDGVSADRPQAP